MGGTEHAGSVKRAVRVQNGTVERSRLGATAVML